MLLLIWHTCKRNISIGPNTRPDAETLSRNWDIRLCFNVKIKLHVSHTLSLLLSISLSNTTVLFRVRALVLMLLFPCFHTLRCFFLLEFPMPGLLYWFSYKAHLGVNCLWQINIVCILAYNSIDSCWNWIIKTGAFTRTVFRFFLFNWSRLIFYYRVFVLEMRLIFVSLVLRARIRQAALHFAAVKIFQTIEKKIPFKNWFRLRCFSGSQSVYCEQSNPSQAHHNINNVAAKISCYIVCTFMTLLSDDVASHLPRCFHEFIGYFALYV